MAELAAVEEEVVAVEEDSEAEVVEEGEEEVVEEEEAKHMFIFKCKLKPVSFHV